MVQGVKVLDKVEKEKRSVKLTRMDLGTDAACDEGSTFPSKRFQETRRGYFSIAENDPYEIWDKH
ncbi:hypothetical protein EDM56_02570 [Brevibacillus fluminis]|uniref:Uncharacterized protein n=1 Tax=Brevibacillus fluminis TaxID=511487 RepID=A0A3M8DXE8_9BACL|nr:hypothetical protein EDM56_02570 [Brevibacillus fluminis]